jgi:hypothetical protein
MVWVAAEWGKDEGEVKRDLNCLSTEESYLL